MMRVGHRPCSVDVARDHARASVFRVVHRMCTGDVGMRRVAAYGEPPGGCKEGKTLPRRLCFAMCAVGIRRVAVPSMGVCLHGDARVGERPRPRGRSRLWELPLEPDPGGSEGSGGGCVGLRGPPNRSHGSSSAPQVGSTPPAQGPVGRTRSFLDVVQAPQGGGCPRSAVPGGWEHRIRTS